MRTVLPRFTAMPGMASTPSAEDSTISASTFMPGRRPSVSSMRTVTGYVVVPPEVVPTTETLVTTPVKVWPSLASEVMFTVWPTATLSMSSSSMFSVIWR